MPKTKKNKGVDRGAVFGGAAAAALPQVGAIGKREVVSLGVRVKDPSAFARKARKGDILLSGDGSSGIGLKKINKYLISFGTGTPTGYHGAVVENVAKDGSMTVLELTPSEGYRRVTFKPGDGVHRRLVRHKDGSKILDLMRRNIRESKSQSADMKAWGASASDVLKNRRSAYKKGTLVATALEELFLPQKLRRKQKPGNCFGGTCFSDIGRGANLPRFTSPADVLRNKNFKGVAWLDIPTTAGSRARARLLKYAPHLVRAGVGAGLGMSVYSALRRARKKTASPATPDATGAAAASGVGGLILGGSLSALPVDEIASRDGVIHVLYTDPQRGAGHYQQARAVAKSLEARGRRVKLVNVEKEFATSPEAYQKLIDGHKRVVSGKAGNLDWIRNYMRFYFGGGLDKDALQRSIKDAGAVVVTNPGLQPALRGSKLPLHVVHSDRNAISPVPTPELGSRWSRKRDIHYGAGGAPYKGARFKDIGNVVIDPDVFKVRRPLNPGSPGFMDPKYFNVTISGGGTGTDVDSVLKELLAAKVNKIDGKQVKYHVVTGGGWDAGKLKKLYDITKNSPGMVKIHGRVPLAAMLQQADFNVLRPHGTTAAESVFAGKPMMLIVRGGLDEKGMPRLKSLNGLNAAELSKRSGAPIASLGGSKFPPNISSTFSGMIPELKRHREGVTAAKKLMRDSAGAVADGVLDSRKVVTKVRPGLRAVGAVGAGAAAAASVLALSSKLKNNPRVKGKRRHKYLRKYVNKRGGVTYVYPKVRKRT